MKKHEFRSLRFSLIIVTISYKFFTQISIKNPFFISLTIGFCKVNKKITKQQPNPRALNKNTYASSNPNTFTADPTQRKYVFTAARNATVSTATTVIIKNSSSTTKPILVRRFNGQTASGSRAVSTVTACLWFTNFKRTVVLADVAI
jgi:hypothetical protein